MNKYQRLMKKTTNVAIKVAVLLSVTGGIYFAASYFEGSITKQKTEAESQFTQNDGLLTSLKSQMDKSDQAQQKFYELQGERTTTIKIATGIPKMRYQ
jgi:hypothetical protein